MSVGETVQLVTCGNSAYALGASVAVRSAAERLSAGVRLHVHFLDNGITDADWNRMIASWSDLPVAAFRYAPNRTLLRTLPLENPAWWGYYSRLLMADLLPPDVDRVIYLDGDVLVLQDLTRLRDEPLGEAVLAAAIEPGVPTVGSPFVRIAEPGKAPPKKRTRPNLIPNHLALGMSPDTPYYNAGVFVTDLARWRAEGLTRVLLDCLREHAKHVRCHDQYAVNVAFRGRIRRLDLRWNRPANLDNFAFPEETGLSAVEFEAARTEPWILHYTGGRKPWLPPYRSARQALYFEHLAHTAWPVPTPATPPAGVPHPLGRLGSKLRRWLSRWTGRAAG